VLLSAADGLGIGLGFTLSLTFLGSLREVLGAGTLFGQAVMGASFEPFTFMVQAPGAFVCLGILLGLMNIVEAIRTR
jgi:electron transport complex protein RnfE